MFCSNCGKELKPDDKFCNQCGKQIQSNIENASSNCIDTEYRETQRENKTPTIIAFIISLSILVIMLLGSRSFGIVLPVIAIGIVVVFIGCTQKSHVGKCPHCDNLVKSSSSTSFVCPFCRKTVMVKDNKFWKVKN